MKGKYFTTTWIKNKTVNVYWKKYLRLLPNFEEANFWFKQFFFSPFWSGNRMTNQKNGNSNFPGVGTRQKLLKFGRNMPPTIYRILQTFQLWITISSGLYRTPFTKKRMTVSLKSIQVARKSCLLLNGKMSWKERI